MILYSSAVNVKSYRFNSGERVLIYPGSNEIPTDKWNAIKKDKMIAANLENGTFKENRVNPPSVKKTEEKKEDSFSDFRDLSESEAIKVIKTTFDIKTLEKWKDSDKRKKVISACESQIKAIRTSK